MTKMIETALNKEELTFLFKKLGILQGDVVEVHIALSKLGYVIGGSQTVIEALLEVVGYNGTIIMPLQAGDRSEPSYFENPPIAFDLHEKYRTSLTAFDPKVSDLWKMSKVSDTLRKMEGAALSHHPTCAFVAYGKYARFLVEDAPLSFPFQRSSTLGKLYDLKAKCLLIGVDYDNMTSLHLSEIEAGIRPIILQGSKIKENEEECWVEYLDYALDADDGFLEIGQNLEKRNLVNKEKIAKGEIKCLRVDVAIDEGIEYYKKRIQVYKKVV